MFALHGRLVIIHPSDYLVTFGAEHPPELIRRKVFEATFVTKEGARTDDMQTFVQRPDVRLIAKQHPVGAAPVEVSTETGPQLCHGGDWVFEGPGGTQWVILDDTFALGFARERGPALEQ